MKTSRLRPTRVFAALSLALLVVAVSASYAADGTARTTNSHASLGSTPNISGIPTDISGTLYLFNTGGSQTMQALKPMTDAFQKATHVSIRSDFSDTDDKFFAAEQAGHVPWDLVLLSSWGDFIKAKKAGYLQKIDTSIVPLQRLSPQARDPYGAQIMSFGSVIAWNTKAFPKTGPQPAGPKDFFDLKKFPGRRCMFQYPEFGDTLELPLLADGVKPGNLYPLDVSRALKKLDTIKSDIVWWSDGADSIQKLVNGSCAMGISYSGRVFNAIAKQHLPLAMTWNGATIAQAALVIPKGAHVPRRGEAFLSWFLQDLAGQKAFVNALSYATSISALPLMSYAPNVRSYVAIGSNAKVAVTESGTYYASHLDSVVKTFNAWAAK